MVLSNFSNSNIINVVNYQVYIIFGIKIRYFKIKQVPKERVIDIWENKLMAEDWLIKNKIK